MAHLFIVAFVVVGAADAAFGVSIANDAEVLSGLVTCTTTEKLFVATLNNGEGVGCSIFSCYIG